MNERYTFQWQTMPYKPGASNWNRWHATYNTPEEAAMAAANFLRDCLAEDTPKRPIVRLLRLRD